MEQEVTDLVTGVTQSPCTAPCNTTRTTARLVHTIQRWGKLGSELIMINLCA